MKTSETLTGRLRVWNEDHINHDGAYVLYWMTSARRPFWNLALQRAVDLAKTMRCPLVVFEPLRVDYEWSSARHHQFIVDGMVDNAGVFDTSSAVYYPYVETEIGGGKGLLKALGEQARVVVTDDFPSFFLPRMLHRASNDIRVRFEAIDGNGLLPMRNTEKVYPSAYTFRRYVQKNLPPFLYHLPQAQPLDSLETPVAVGCRTERLRQSGIPSEILARWAPAFDVGEAVESATLDHLPYRCQVSRVNLRGGWSQATHRMDAFLSRGMSKYGIERNHPDQRDGSSGLSPYLHFGHIASTQVVAAILEMENWAPHPGMDKTHGKRAGWWGMSEGAESYLDQIITWRELGYNMCALRQDFDRYTSLPDWAQTTLAEHASDPRPNLYTLDEFAEAKTHDPLWNAAQRELVTEGRMHNYLRMLWAKKILHWSPTPQAALSVLIELNNRYALDGRNPNSYSGIFWCLGRYDRPWGPERPVFGKIRYMTSASTRSKLKVKDYLVRYSGQQTLLAL